MKLKASTYQRLTSQVLRLTLLLILVAFSNSYAALYKEGEIIVKFKSNPSNQTLKSQAISKTLNIHVIKLPSNMKVEDALKKYKNDPNVEYAEPNYIIKKLETIPNDPYYPSQWGLVKVLANKVWDACKGSDNTIVAVIDSGIDLNHPDLKDHIWKNTGETNCNDGIDNDNNGFVDDCYGWNFASNNNNTQDDDGHGTHVAGIIGAVTNNNVGVAGLNWYVKLMSVKILDSTGSGDVANLIKAIDYAVKNGAKIINSSLGYPDSCSYVPPSQALYDAIKSAGDRGVLFVAAAGNYGCNNDKTPLWPASFNLPNIISVGASDQNDNLAYFSSYGQNSVHLLAPGTNIISTYFDKTNNQSTYKSLSGTSMAAPFVSGAAALLMSCLNNPTIYEIRERIVSSVDVFDSLSSKTISSGRLNIYNALNNPLKPIRPTGLALALNNNNAILTWQDNSNIETGYIVERKSDNSNWTVIARLGVNATSYTDNNLTSGTYYYRVKAVYNTEESLYSNEASITVSNPSSTSSSGGSSGSGGGGGGCSMTAGTSPINLLYWLIVPVYVLLRRVSHRNVKM
ncbi:S8 family serine peptidase [Sulfurihydrogenibium sp.]|uniref:S8 family serine peptidase n=1 Tax=Sulfurihydrogenibium sp. TaxID=2053621 RepID=UPI00262B6588|nr:S8 family serine peptidase [Sulfurihydrogenibium sp.]